MKTYNYAATGPGKGLILGLLASILFISSGYSQTTTWTGAVDNDWSNAGNWTHGVPDGTTEVIFIGEGAQNLDVALPLGAFAIGSIRFNADATDSVTVSRTTSGNIDFAPGNSIVVEAGSGSHTIQNSSSGSGYFRFAPGVDSYIRNDSVGTTLTLIGRFVRTTSGTPNIIFDGSGNILLTGSNSLVDASAGNIIVAASMTGTVIFDTPFSVVNNHSLILNGGTTIFDGTARNRTSSGFQVNAGAVLTGNGRIGTNNGSAGDSHTRDIQINGGTVDPGRVGAVGTLTFENNDVHFNSGSTMVFDLLNSVEYDRILLRLDGGGGANVVPTLYLTDTTLQLNLLSGFEAEVSDVFTILDGYKDIMGAFTGLADGEVIVANGYEFQISYGESATTLQVIAIPEVEAVTLILSVLALVGYRLAGRRVSPDSRS